MIKDIIDLILRKNFREILLFLEVKALSFDYIKKVPLIRKHKRTSCDYIRVESYAMKVYRLFQLVTLF